MPGLWWCFRWEQVNVDDQRMFVISLITDQQNLQEAKVDHLQNK